MKNLLIKTIGVGALFGILLALQAVSPLMAQNDTDQESTDSAVNDELVKRIEKVVEEKKVQVKEVLGNLGSQKQGLIGEVQRVSEEAITITHSTGNRIIPITDSVSLKKGSKSVALAEIAVGDWVEVLGANQDSLFSPQFVFVYTKTLRPTPQKVFTGTIKDLTATSMTVVPRDVTMPETEVSLLKTTDYEDVTGDEAKRTEFVEDGAVLVVALEKEGTNQALTIRSLVPLSELQ